MRAGTTWMMPSLRVAPLKLTRSSQIAARHRTPPRVLLFRCHQSSSRSPHLLSCIHTASLVTAHTHLLRRNRVVAATPSTPRAHLSYSGPALARLNLPRVHTATPIPYQREARHLSQPGPPSVLQVSLRRFLVPLSPSCAIPLLAHADRLGSRAPRRPSDAVSARLPRPRFSNQLLLQLRI